jgi:type II secretory pathway component GspD/PulD (secretin)
MISSAMSKFHGVKSMNQQHPHLVATAIQVAAPPTVLNQAPIQAEVIPTKDPQPTPKTDVAPKKDVQAPIQAEVVPKKDAQTPIKADAVPPTVVAAQTPQKPAEQKSATPKVATTNGLVTNLFVDTDIKAVINEVASLAGVTIIADETVKEQSISIEFKNEPIESVVEKLGMVAGAYWKQQAPGVFLISKATPDAAFFPKFAETRIYSVKNQTAASIQSLLSVAYKTYLSFDPKTNSIGICAPRQLLEKIMADIEKADRQSRQIYVEAIVTEISLDDSLNTGFSWSLGKWSLGSDLSINAQAATGADMLKIQALLGNKKMTLKANPHVMATSGQEASINVGQDTYYSLLSGSTVYPTTQIQLIHTGVILKFTGVIGEDGLITMQLDPQVSDAVTSVNGNPTSNIRTASTRVRVKSGQTIVIAGLVQETSTKQTIRVPVLGYIPLVGEIFTQRTNDKKKVETIFLITPKIVDNN